MVVVNDMIITDFLVGKDEISAKMQQIGTQTSKVDNAAREAARAFDMFNLSLVFGGLALQQFGMQALRFLVPAMEVLEDLNTEGAKKVMALGAAYEFLKISLFETLTTSELFGQFVVKMIEMALAISEFVQENPRVLELAAALAAIATAMGTILFVAGTLGTISTVFKGLAFDVAAFITAFGPIGVVVAAILLILAGAVLLGLAFEDTRAIMSDMWEKGFKEPSERLLEALGSVFDSTVTWQDVLLALANVGVLVFGAIALVVQNIVDRISELIILTGIYFDLLTGDTQGVVDGFGQLGSQMLDSAKNSGDLLVMMGEAGSGAFKALSEDGVLAEEQLMSIDENMSLLTDDTILAKEEVTGFSDIWSSLESKDITLNVDVNYNDSQGFFTNSSSSTTGSITG